MDWLVTILMLMTEIRMMIQIQNGVSFEFEDVYPKYRYQSKPGTIYFKGTNVRSVADDSLVFMIDSVKCAKLIANSTHGKCDFDSFPTPISTSFEVSSIRFNFNHTGYFRIYPDPNISATSTRETLTSAKIGIEFSGSNFKSLYMPSLQAVANDYKSPHEPCDVRSDNTMICKTPDISDKYATLDVTMKTELIFWSHQQEITHLIVKDLKFRELVYLRDPKFLRATVREAEDGQIIEIEVEYMPIKWNPDIQLNLTNKDVIFCSHPSFSGIVLSCSLSERLPAHVKYIVSIKFYDKYYSIDNTGSTELSVEGFIVPGIMGILFVIAVITVLFMISQTKLNPANDVRVNPFTGELDIERDTFTGYTLYTPRTQFTKTTRSSSEDRKRSSSRSYNSESKGSGSGGKKKVGHK